MTKILSAEIIQSIALESIPTGTHKGHWGGYEATAIINGETFRFKTKDGIRTPKAKCLIHVKKDSVTVTIYEWKEEAGEGE